MKIIALFLIAITFNCNAGSPFLSIENLIFEGDFALAKYKINDLLKTAKGKEKALLYQLKGDALKLEGDLDEAFKYWKKSNEWRNKTFPKGNYHLAWNYALLSNYYYEKIEPKLAVRYADSCVSLLINLNNKQQKEIQIFKIWNILGQSYKLGLSGIDKKIRLKKYENIRSYYFKSLKYIRKEKYNPYYEAKTLHLIGNSYVDNIYDFLSEKDNFETITKLKIKAQIYYQKANKVWNRNPNTFRYERAKTLYVNALMLSILPKAFFPNALSESVQLFKEAELAFGLDKDLSKVPNKQDALQCLWLHKGALYEETRRTNTGFKIDELEKLNQTSISLWKIVYNNFKTKNLNQILSIYGLVPYQDVITIENLKRKFNKQWSKDKIFEANQMLKYYDLNRFNPNSTYHNAKPLNEVQQKLKNNECFLDFISDYQFLFITKNKTEFVELDPYFFQKLDSLNTAIVNQDFHNFCSISHDVYKALFIERNLKGISTIHISPAERYNTLPFEALLQSEKGLSSKLYSKLDYLIRSKQINYYLSASYLFKEPKKINFTGTALSPRSQSFSELPFSEKLAQELHTSYGFHWVESQSIQKRLYNSADGNILHFSGHGIIDTENPTLSRLDFCKGFLSLEEVYQMNIKTPFIVLNACNSQNGKTNIGDGVNGFARAFHAMGTQASIANMWEVDDQASNLLFSNFYSNLSTGGSIHLAFRKAQLNFIEGKNGFDAPYYWAGHRLYGDIEFDKHKKTPNSMYIWILGVLGLVGIPLIFRFLLKSK